MGGGLGKPATVTSLVVKGDSLLVGGSFTSAGGDSSIRNLALWHTDAWHKVGGGIEGVVHSLVLDGNDLYVGGRVESSGIIRWDGDQWHAIGNGVSETVLDIALAGNDLFVIGGFTSIPFSTLSFRYVARYDRTLDSWAPLQNGLSNSGFSLGFYQNSLWIACQFICFYQWNGLQLQNTNAGGTTSQINSIKRFVNYNGRMYVGGSFVNLVDIDSADFIAYREGNNWHSLGSGIISGMNSIGTYDILPYKDNLFITGKYTSHDSSVFSHGVFRYNFEKNRFYRLNHQKFTSPQVVTSLAMYKGNLVAGGAFGEVNGDTSLQNLVIFRQPDQPVQTASPIQNPKIQLYPNPVKNQLFLKCREIDPEKPLQITIQSVTGSTWIEEEVWPLREINVQVLPPGMYFMRVKHSAGTSSMRFLKS